MNAEPVSCTVKSPVPLQIGDSVSDSCRPGVYVIDITIPEPVNIEEISFKNYYTAFLTVRLLQKRRKSGSKWVMALRNYRLMNNPHAEGGSHDYFSIPRKQGLPDPGSVSSSIQQMWALTEIMQASQTAASIGRFDVEGSYDVKSLSYT
ncbi:hypothetical protein DNTS_012168 [Danionella cerebrum]|uniref:Uncharacterized protein n=1 Tax=Danionella cerebrum TaxID=2873325 RepID=A0A553QVL0_9TELE|nr:hypothetical protein DNTS_012168 [Danionella translucida]